jgi:AraC-like DNA-binding protein
MAHLMLVDDLHATAARVSTEVGVSRRTVERSVQAIFNLTFRELRNHILIDRFAQLARQHPDWSVKQVAYELGYTHPRSLSRHIRKLTRASPRQLIRR